MVPGVSDMDGVTTLNQTARRTLLSLAVAGVTSVVEYFMLPSPLSEEDLARYHLLITAYRRNLHYTPKKNKTATSSPEPANLSAIRSEKPASLKNEKDNTNTPLLTNEATINLSPIPQITQATLPDSWALDAANRPTRAYDYSVFMRNLNADVAQLSSKNSEIFLARASMLALLAKYFNSILKHKMDYWFKDGLRNDGIEAMFFSEMIHWLLHVLPELPDLDKITPVIVEQRMLYCKEVYDLVFENNPSVPGLPQRNLYRQKTKDTVFRLSQQMNGYHKNLVQRRDSRHFNNHIDQLNTSMLGLSEKSLHIFYSLIKGTDKTHFIVEQFLNPYESDTAIVTIRKTRLGHWLWQTLSAAGITSSTYTSQTIVSLESSITHLTGEHPQDNNYKLSKELKNTLDMTEWGHWDFVKQAPFIDRELDGPRATDPINSIFPEESIRAAQYLTQIRDLYRYILRFQFIRQNLVRTTQVAAVFGEIWIYGDPAGKAVLEELLKGIEEEIKAYSTLFNQFWSHYYTQHYLPVAMNARTNDIKSAEHVCLTTLALNDIPTLQQIIEDIRVSISEIRIQSQQLPHNIERATRTKKQLFADVLDFLKFCGKQGSPNFNLIQNALSDLEKGTSSETTLDSKVDPDTARQTAANQIKQEAAEKLQMRVTNSTSLQDAINTRIAEEEKASQVRMEAAKKQAKEETACTLALLDNCKVNTAATTQNTLQKSAELKKTIAEKTEELTKIEHVLNASIAELETHIKTQEGLRINGIFPPATTRTSSVETNPSFISKRRNNG